MPFQSPDSKFVFAALVGVAITRPESHVHRVATAFSGVASYWSLVLEPGIPHGRIAELGGHDISKSSTPDELQSGVDSQPKPEHAEQTTLGNGGRSHPVPLHGSQSWA
jgi:hypothetical protein